jgi:hypothetical protein
MAGIGGFCFLLCVAVSPSFGAMKIESFALSGSGSFMDSPPFFSGVITAGTLSPGNFWFQIDDTGWPSDNPLTPNNERWDHIFANYFQYDAETGNEGWDGRFVSTGLIPPEWRFWTAGGDTCGGLTTSFTVSIRDYNANGIMEDNEYINKVFSIGLFCYINFGTGEFTSFCGQGNCSGTMDLVDEETWSEDFYVPSETSASGRLYLNDASCQTATKPSSWGRIKYIYNR